MATWHPATGASGKTVILNLCTQCAELIIGLKVLLHHALFLSLSQIMTGEVLDRVVVAVEKVQNRLLFYVT